MQYVLAVKGEVYGSQAAYLAYQFAEQLLASGHEIRQIFFFQNGVSNANMLVNPASDEVNLVEHWKNWQKTTACRCISASLLHNAAALLKRTSPSLLFWQAWANLAKPCSKPIDY